MKYDEDDMLDDDKYNDDGICLSCDHDAEHCQCVDDDRDFDDEREDDSDLDDNGGKTL